MNLKNLKNLKRGIKELTPEQQLNARYSGTIGTIIGFTLAFVALLIKLILAFDWSQLCFCIVLFFATFISVVSLIGMKQQKEQFKNIKELQKKLETGEL